MGSECQPECHKFVMETKKQSSKILYYDYHWLVAEMKIIAMDGILQLPRVYGSKEENSLPKLTAEKPTAVIMMILFSLPQPNNHLRDVSTHSGKTNLPSQQVISGLHHFAPLYFFWYKPSVAWAFGLGHWSTGLEIHLHIWPKQSGMYWTQ